LRLRIDRSIEREREREREREKERERELQERPSGERAALLINQDPFRESGFLFFRSKFLIILPARRHARNLTIQSVGASDTRCASDISEERPDSFGALLISGSVPSFPPYASRSARRRQRSNGYVRRDRPCLDRSNAKTSQSHGLIADQLLLIPIHVNSTSRARDIADSFYGRSAFLRLFSGTRVPFTTLFFTSAPSKARARGSATSSILMPARLSVCFPPGSSSFHLVTPFSLAW